MSLHIRARPFLLQGAGERGLKVGSQILLTLCGRRDIVFGDTAADGVSGKAEALRRRTEVCVACSAEEKRVHDIANGNH
jgi:hypothetical protein